ncbi:hypothetical protein P4K96_29545, partial [Bacillus cereus]|nr:hypothetical protein [Bacillus cereus]
MRVEGRAIVSRDRSVVGARRSDSFEGQERGEGEEGRKLQKCSIFGRFCCEKKKFLHRSINFVKERGDGVDFGTSVAS